MTKLSLLIAALTVFTAAAYAGGGNGAPVGQHYNLNIIGVPNDKSADMNGNNGHRIFVPLTGTCKIMLSPTDDFNDLQVLDANGTDGTAAFQLPVPGENYCWEVTDPDTGAIDVVCPTSATVDYQIWARALGKPDGSATMKTCMTDPYLNDAVVCSDADWTLTLTSKAGQSKFINVTQYLLFVSADVDGDNKLEHVQIFDPLFSDYFWEYDNNGLKLAQLRFYPIEMSWTW